MNDRAFADLLSDLDAELADPCRGSHAADEVLGRIKRSHPAAVQQCAAVLQLAVLGLSPLGRAR
jgi:hypothetical protein